MIIILLTLLVILFLVHQLWYRRLGIPPGPFPLPIIGNLHSFWWTKRWEYKFLEWREQYGSIYAYWFGFDYIITVNDYKTAYEMFVKDGDTYADRAAIESLDYATRGNLYGIIESSGPLWKEQRRFALRTLHEFGVGKSMMQDRIVEEIEYVFENVNKDIDSGLNEEMDFYRYTDIATGSVINSIVNGYRFTVGGKEKEFYYMKKLAEDSQTAFTNPLILLASIYRSLSKIPPFKGPFERTIKIYEEINKYLAGIIEDHEKHQDYSEDIEPRDFIDSYLLEMKRCEERGEMGYFSKQQLQNVIFDAWIAGQETTSITLTWMIAYIICYPEVQKRMQEELDRVVGNNRLVFVSDKVNLPFVNATIMETQRLANIVPQNIPHRTTRDVQLAGCTVKKGTVILPQISVMCIDPNVFEKPLEFNPDRFLDSNGQLKKAEELVPFSMGKRQCLGEGLARMELFLFLANLVHRYQFLPTNTPPVLEKASTGFSMRIIPYKCHVEKRF